jgi:hypothetical protein
MIGRYGRQTVLIGMVLCLVLWHSAQLQAAERAVTGVVVKSGFSGLIVNSGGPQPVKYQTGRKTVFSPGHYRPQPGDTVTVRFSPKTRANGRVALVAAAVAQVKKAPARQEITSPAVGLVRKVGWRRIRFDFPASGQVVTMEMKRGTKKEPPSWRPAAGDRVRVYFTKVRARFGRKMVLVISRIEKIK